MISKKPGKQRKHKRNAPMHQRRKIMSSHLSPELKNKLKKRAIPVKKGDEVVVMRGSFKGLKGKVEQVKRKPFKVFIENIFYEKKNGTKVKLGLDASKIMITSLDTADVKRIKGENK